MVIVGMILMTYAMVLSFKVLMIAERTGSVVLYTWKALERTDISQSYITLLSRVRDINSFR